MTETVAAAIRAATERLSETSDTARLDAELLMAHALRTRRQDMLHYSVQEMDAPPELEQLIARRLDHEPIAYILGNQEFFGRTFKVTPDVLIPRSDSETLIDAAKDVAGGAKRVLDLGTGSGALFVTALLEIKGSSGIAIDASQAALYVAENNAQLLGLDRKQAKFIRADWTKAGWANQLGQFDLILCNPPYVETTAELDPDVRDFEPHTALFAGEEGLDDYRVIIPQLGKLLVKAGVAVLEIGASQAEAVTKIARDSGFSVELRRDLANRPRALILT